MIVSLCVFGFGQTGKDFIEKFRSLDGYGSSFRIHMVHVNKLKEHPEAALNSRGQWKLNDEHFEDESLGLSIGDDLEWLRESGYEGHDVIVDCSDEGDYFAEEIEYQMSTNPNMLFYACTELNSVDATIEKLVEEIAARANKA